MLHGAIFFAIIQFNYAAYMSNTPQSSISKNHVFFFSFKVYDLQKIEKNIFFLWNTDYLIFENVFREQTCSKNVIQLY